MGYAYYDPKFRAEVERNVPYSKEVFDFVYQEGKKTHELQR